MALLIMPAACIDIDILWMWSIGRFPRLWDFQGSRCKT